MMAIFKKKQTDETSGITTFIYSVIGTEEELSDYSLLKGKYYLNILITFKFIQWKCQLLIFYNIKNSHYIIVITSNYFTPILTNFYRLNLILTFKNIIF